MAGFLLCLRRLCAPHPLAQVEHLATWLNLCLQGVGYKKGHL